MGQSDESLKEAAAGFICVTSSKTSRIVFSSVLTQIESFSRPISVQRCNPTQQHQQRRELKEVHQRRELQQHTAQRTPTAPTMQSVNRSTTVGALTTQKPLKAPTAATM